MRLRLRHCSGGLKACCVRCSTLEQLCSVLNLINPWACSNDITGWTLPLASAARHRQHSNSSSISSSISDGDSRASNKQNNNWQTQPWRKSKHDAVNMKDWVHTHQPPDGQPHHTALETLSQQKPSSKTFGLRSRAALNAAVAAATAASNIVNPAAAEGAHCPNSYRHRQAAEPTQVAAAPQDSEPSVQQQQPQQQQVPECLSAPTSSSSNCNAYSSGGCGEGAESIADSNSGSTGYERASDTPSGSSSSSNSGVSSSCSLGVPGDDAFTTHPLPSYALNDEEQDSFAKAKNVVAQLQSRGYKALIVGGWVRDKFLGKRSSDIDISTNATPWELKKLFRDVVELPRSTVKVNHQGEVLEVTCFRGISRAASMFSVAMDAARRDFTINALYYDPITDQVLDCVGGVDDAKQRVLRLTGDSVSRLEEDPLRVLRCVRFVTVLGLRLAPATAQAVKQHAHLCSIKYGLPPRRIWLELCKLRRAEQQQAGSWAVALKLCYHLGALQHIFPWLQPDNKQPGSTPVHASVVQQQQAVLIAERLGQLWQRRNIPLGLMVAATLHPAASNSEQACQQLESYFTGLPDDLAAVRTYLQGAQLTHGSSPTRSTHSQEDEWVQFYASQHASTCLHILAAWIPDAVAGSFQQLQQARMLQLQDRITHHQQLLQMKREQQAGGQRQLPTLSSGAASKALQQRRIRQKEELTAAIQALVGEQEQQAKQEQQQSATY